MGKKKGDADAPLGMTPEQAAEAADAQDLLRHAVRSGVLSETRRLPAKGVALPPGDHVVAQSHRDIMKKPAQRKHRYLVLLCAQIAPVAAGKIGSLAKLDTRNPVMYLDFEAGRLKLLGTLAFPKARYLVLRPGPNEHVLCEDVFESVIVFSRAVWVGSKEDNPDEDPLDMPATFGDIAHTGADFGGGAGKGPTVMTAEGGDDTGMSDGQGDGDSGSDGEGDGGGGEAVAQWGGRRSRRPKVSYADEEESEEEASDAGEDDAGSESEWEQTSGEE